MVPPAAFHFPQFRSPVDTLGPEADVTLLTCGQVSSSLT